MYILDETGAAVMNSLLKENEGKTSLGLLNSVGSKKKGGTVEEENNPFSRLLRQAGILGRYSYPFPQGYG